MEMYITSGEVGRFAQALRSRGMETFEEDGMLKILLNDGSYRKVTIIDLPKPSELLDYMMGEQKKTLFTLMID